MAILIMLVIFIGIIIYSLSGSSYESHKKDFEFEDIYLIDEDCWDDDLF